jgi:4a-hydroxytetrahydrobiopterin dehydratase
MDLLQRKCVPCEGGVPKLEAAAIARYQPEVPSWRVDDDRLKRAFRFRDFVQAMAFVNRVAEIAEAEQHHPDLAIHYNHVDVEIWTHAIGGLSENDFILAAKIDALGA